jgi:hypothetical protein
MSLTRQEAERIVRQLQMKERMKGASLNVLIKELMDAANKKPYAEAMKRLAIEMVEEDFDSSEDYNKYLDPLFSLLYRSYEFVSDQSSIDPEELEESLKAVLGLD